MPSRPVVVLVEDHEDTREMYADCLTFLGFRVVTAVDAENGFLAATSEDPAAVVTDFRLPGASGADLCNWLKRDDRTRHVPTLLVTASTQRRDVENALSNGCAIVRLKPYLPDALARDILALVAGEAIPQWPSEYAV